jgi:hypothetical protein
MLQNLMYAQLQPSKLLERPLSSFGGRSNLSACQVIISSDLLYHFFPVLGTKRAPMDKARVTDMAGRASDKMI